MDLLKNNLKKDKELMSLINDYNRLKELMSIIDDYNKLIKKEREDKKDNRGSKMFFMNGSVVSISVETTEGEIIPIE